MMVKSRPLAGAVVCSVRPTALNCPDVSRLAHGYLLLAVFFVVSLVSSFLGYVGHGLRLSWTLFAVFVLAATVQRPSFVSDVLRVASSRHRELVAFAVWYIVVLTNAALGRGFSGTSHAMVATTLAMLVLLDLACGACGTRAREIVRSGVTVLVGVDLFRSIPELLGNPQGSRLRMAFGEWATDFEQSYMTGVGEYGLYTACAIAFPIVLATILRSHRMSRLLWVAVGASWVCAVLLSTFLGAAVLLVCGGVAYIVMLTSARRSIGAAIAGVTALTTLGLLSWYVLTNTESGRYISEKAETQLESITLNGVFGGDRTGRVTLWGISAQTFAHNPLFGVGATTMRQNPNVGIVVGGHSTLFDLPAEYGVVGTIPFLLFVSLRGRRIMRARAAEERVEFVVASRVCFLLYAIGGIYNPVTTVGAINALWIVGTLRSEYATGLARPAAWAVAPPYHRLGRAVVSGRPR